MESSRVIEETLARIGVSVKNNNGEYVAFADVLAEIKNKWEALSEGEQDNICSLLSM